MVDVRTVQTALAVVLVALGLLAFVVDQLLVAGVAFLALSLTIYLRERTE